MALIRKHHLFLIINSPVLVLSGKVQPLIQLRDPHFELLAREGGLLLKKLLHLGKGVGDIHYFFQES